MKKFLLLALLSSLGVSGVAEEMSLKINKFGGMLEDIDPLFLPEGASQESSNVITDLGNGLLPREGYISYSTETPKEMWIFQKSDGTKYLIEHTGNELKADTGNKDFSVSVSTVAASIVAAGAQLGDYFYFCNAVDGLKKWDGTTVSVADASMTFDKLVTWKGRLAGSGKASNERTIYLSKLLDGDTWDLAVNPSEDDPVRITVGGALDENISGLFASYKDILMWFKNNSFGGVYGSRRSNFVQRTFSETVGSNHVETVQDCDGNLRFLGPRRTVWEFDLTELKKISEGNNTLFQGLLNGEGNTRTATVTDQIDYEAGTSAGLSTTITPGSILLSTWTATDTSQADFDAGTVTQMETTSAGIVKLGATDVNPDNYGFESGAGTDASNWAESGTWQRVSGAVFGTWMEKTTNGGSASFTLYICQTGGSPCVSQGYTVDGTWRSYSITTTSMHGRNAYYQFRNNLGENLTSDVFYFSDGLPSTGFYSKWDGTNVYIDQVGPFTKSTIYDGNFVSQSFDTGFSSPAWTPSNATYAANGNTLTFETQSSSDGSSWDSLVSWSPGVSPGSAYKRYIRYKVTVATQTASTGFPSVSDATFSARQSSGTFVSEVVDAGTSINAWNVFQDDETLNDGTITYGFYTDSDTSQTIGGDGLPVVGTFTSSQTITNNTIPSISTAPYAYMSAKFDITASTQNPTNSRMSITWGEGSTLKAKGIWTNQRYWLAGSLASATTNDTIFVFDRNRQWQKYTGLNVDEFLLFDQSPLFSNTSGLWQGETGNSDNGTDITSSYQTRYFAPAGTEMRAYLRELWMTTAKSDATLSTSLYHDGVSTPLTLGAFIMNERNGYQVKKLPIPISDLQLMRHVSLKWDVSGTEEWRILNGSLYFDPDTQRE